ncbi:MotA/TolQ/ExbB proton channel family protein [Thiobacillus denitrificans]|uniref:Biopolymer transport protein ExbB n=1 Tax=Thiobacillus denitrificans TaxID=36861 RepID=A0A106BIW6_THIDE|nr:MotA/TolQ/ExbB proton channel family protein [Thiobacillus denitrificans]KVW93310.1 biopolymer transporter ExbB [Thiobacillus denitrificans]
METAATQTQLGFAHFIAQADGLAHFLLVVLLVMSVITWTLIVSKSIANWRMKKHAQAFLARFWDAPGLASVAEYLQNHGVNDPFSHLTHHGLKAAEQYRNKTGQRLIESGSEDEFLTRALRRAINQDTARLEYGHTMLASIASSAPFVGLFGTVWGIYHALVNIGMSGSGSLDQVAGPVGEALIMTALGLAVAIPAVLAYNFFNRAKRQMLSEVDGFAHDLFAFMSTGVRNNTRIEKDAAQVYTAPVARSA